MAERNLPGQPEQDIQADADDGGERDQRQDEMRIAFGEGADRKAGSGDGEDRKRRRDRREVSRIASDLVHGSAAEQAVRHDARAPG